MFMSCHSKITGADFVTSVFNVSKLPKEHINEVAFIGRSNVGKSSLINAVVGIKNLAKVSSMPGRTQSFNYFQVHFSNIQEDVATKHSGNLVDLPGYGYAVAGKKLSNKWAEQIENYLSRREQLSGIFLLMDCRREPGQEEKFISKLGRNGKFVLLLTKVDKISNNEFVTIKTGLLKKLRLSDNQILAVSTVGNKKLTGVPQVRDLMCQWLTP